MAVVGYGMVRYMVYQSQYMSNPYDVGHGFLRTYYGTYSTCHDPCDKYGPYGAYRDPWKLKTRVKYV